MNWSEIRSEAKAYVQSLTNLCPRYLDEMHGIADAAQVEWMDIIALNVRTEIAFGLFSRAENSKDDILSDGCTAIAYRAVEGDTHSFLGQNWDWQTEQAKNLVICHITHPKEAGLPRISMVTEAGIIGKIGLNESGVGVCLNAIRAKGVSHTQLPIHLALRTVLESHTKMAAINDLRSKGIAGSGHILIADETGAVGLECTSKGIKELVEDDQGFIAHTNHLLLDHPDVEEPPWIPDSFSRIDRARSLLGSLESSKISCGFDHLWEVFKDEENYPVSINRCQVDSSGMQTLFNIRMDLTQRTAIVTFGRPSQNNNFIELSF